MGEADEIRELAERLLTHLIPGSDVPTITLLPGRGPDDPDLSVPSPPGARIIGSLIREPGWQLPRDIEVVLDAPGSEDQLLRFYEEQFGQRGWRVAPQSGHQRGGFMAGPEGEGRMLRRGDDDLILLLTARPVKAGWVEVRLRTQWIPADTEIHQPPPGHDLIPALRQPAGVQVMTARGGGGGSGYWTSEAAVETPKAVSELEAHFASQLEKAGGKRGMGVLQALSPGAAGRCRGKANGTATCSSWKRLARTAGRSGSGSNRRATGTAGGTSRPARSARTETRKDETWRDPASHSCG